MWPLQCQGSNIANGEQMQKYLMSLETWYSFNEMEEAGGLT